MKVLYFVHTYGERNGISNHVQSIVRVMPHSIKPAVIGGTGASLPLFSSLRFPLFEFPKALLCGFDLIHVHGYGNFYSFFGAILSILKRKPLVWTIHGYPRIGGPRRVFYLVYRYLMAPVVFWRAGRIISVSSDIVPLLEKETRKPITVMPNGIDLGVFKPKGSYRTAECVCYVGRLDEDKGVERMLECSSFPLLFIGPDEGGMRGRLEKQAARLGRRAEFAECKPDAMQLQYGRCRYVVLPSKYEGFPLTLLESIAMERPFISTDVGEVKATLSSLFSKPERYLLRGGIGEKIAGLEKLDLRPEMRAARKKAAPYSWKSLSKKLASIYLELG
jgi:glycosyltransferase involved in cell wall biosynthesis